MLKLSLSKFSDKAEYGKLILKQLAIGDEQLQKLQQLNLSECAGWFSDRTYGNGNLQLLLQILNAVNSLTSLHLNNN